MSSKGGFSQGGAQSEDVLELSFVLVVVTALISCFLFAAVYGVAVGSAGRAAPSPAAPIGTGPDYVYLSINANPDISPSTADQYEPANFTVPSHTLLIFEITNYDTGENPVSPAFARVNGTLGSSAFLNGSSAGVHLMPAGQVAHTFSFVRGPYAGFNVPVLAAGNSTPTTVLFSVYFNDTGSFIWNCMAPCDSWSMAHSGYMTGTMTVVGA